MAKRRSSGKAVFLLFIILSILSAIIASYFPLVEKYVPSVAHGINQFRGYYDGPLLLEPDEAWGEFTFSPQYPGARLKMREEQIFRFIPAADTTMELSAFYEMGDSLIELYLSEASNMEEVLKDNLSTPFATGRQADAYSQRGEAEPEHGNFFSYDFQKGTSYAVKVVPKDPEDIGKAYTIRISPGKARFSLQTLWAGFEIVLVLLLALYFVGRILGYKKENRNR